LAWAPPTGTISGRFFLSAEPYKTGITPAAVQAQAGGGNSGCCSATPPRTSGQPWHWIWARAAP